MFWASDNLFHQFSYLDIHDVRFTAFLVNDANPTVVPSVRHSLMDGGLDQDSDLLPGFIDSQDSAQTYLASLTRPLAKKGPRP